MIDLRLTAAVGERAPNKTADVMAVQTCLANLRGRTRFGVKPLYLGRIDGKFGPKTLEAIASFQALNAIKPTGRVDPFGPTIQKLKNRTPSHVAPHTLPAGNHPSSPGLTAKVRQSAEKAAKDIRDSSPLPSHEAEALAAVALKSGALGIAIKLQQTRITPSGRFEATLVVDKSVHSQSDAKLVASIARNVSNVVGKSPVWAVGNPTTMTY